MPGRKKAYKIKWLYECFGLSKQAYYKKIKAVKRREETVVKIKEMIETIQKKMPRYGTEKLHLDIANKLTQSNIKIGRDKFLNFCRQHRLLVRRMKRSFITTDSKHFFYKSAQPRERPDDIAC